MKRSVAEYVYKKPGVSLVLPALVLVLYIFGDAPQPSAHAKRSQTPHGFTACSSAPDGITSTPVAPVVLLTFYLLLTSFYKLRSTEKIFISRPPARAFAIRGPPF